MALRTVNTQDHAPEIATSIVDVPFSLGVWVYLDSLPSNRPIMSVGDDTHSGDHYSMFVEAAGYRLRSWRQYNSGASAQYSTSTGTGSVPLGTWRHALMVCAAVNDITLYAQGVLVSTDTVSLSINGSWDKLMVGNSVGDTYGISAAFAEAAAWDVALTPSEAMTLGQRYSALYVRPQNLVHYAPWVTDEAYDYITNGVFTVGSSVEFRVSPPKIIYPGRHDVLPRPLRDYPVLRAEGR